MRQIAIKPHVDGLFLLTSAYQTAFFTTFDLMIKKGKRVYLRSQSIHVKKFFPDCGVRTSCNNQITIKSEFPATFSFLRDDFWHIQMSRVTFADSGSTSVRKINIARKNPFECAKRLKEKTSGFKQI